MAPLYDYICTACKHEFEDIRKMSEALDDTTCEKCGSVAERKISGFGMYETKGDNSASTPPKCTVRTRTKAN